MKKFDLKSMCIGIVTGSLLFGGIVGASTLITDNVYLNSYPVTVDGKSYTPTLPILNYAGSTYVPLKEFGTITGASVTFSNNTIVVKKPTTTSTGTSTGTSAGTSTGTSTTTPTTSKLNGTKLTVDVNSKASFYVDLSAYGAKSANVSISSGTAYASLSKTSLTASGSVNVTGKKAGSATIKVAYSNGYTDYVSVKVEGNDEIEIDVGDHDYIDIDLDEYDASKATLSVSSGSSYITLAKTSVTKSTEVKVTGKKAGEATVKVKYDSGDIVYFDIIVSKGSGSDDEFDVVLDYEEGKFVFYVDLEEYDADSAKVYVDDDDDCIKVSKEKFTSSGVLTITGIDIGEAEIEIEFDTDDVITINVEVVKTKDFDFDEYQDDAEDDLEIDVDDYDYIDVDPDDYDADWATISVIAGTEYITVSKTRVTTDSEIKVTGKDEGKAVIQITYSTGDIEYYYVEVID